MTESGIVARTLVWLDAELVELSRRIHARRSAAPRAPSVSSTLYVTRASIVRELHGLHSLTCWRNERDFEAQARINSQTDLAGRCGDIAPRAAKLAVQRSTRHRASRCVASIGDVAERRTQNLRTTRDLLLPKLISGELDVSAMPEPEALAA